MFVVDHHHTNVLLLEEKFEEITMIVDLNNPKHISLLIRVMFDEKYEEKMRGDQLPRIFFVYCEDNSACMLAFLLFNEILDRIGINKFPEETFKPSFYEV
jgi:hypothetical protein